MSMLIDSMNMLLQAAPATEEIANAMASGDAAIGKGLAAIGGGVAAIGAGLGIGRLSGSAQEGIARQPEAANDIRGLTILTAAFVEGAALFAVVVALLAMVL